ncbi:hypothetical protein N7507_004554 [Penicillium longicatenatum]|nr:hypothetical protein N7507_004554 [Penicillium longicatenatum]
MDPELAANIRISEHDRPGGIVITIRRAENDCSYPCIFRWSCQLDGWTPSGFMLFQHTPKTVKGKNKSTPPQTLKLIGYEVEAEQLLPGQTLGRNIGFPDKFEDNLVAGERYEVFWPGAEYALWGQEIGVNLGLPRVIIPGGACCSLTCVEKEDILISEPEDPRVEKSRRIPGTPYISVVLDDPSTFSKAEEIYFTAKITYEGLTNDDHEAIPDVKPIIIHDYPFSGDNYRLQRRCPDLDPTKDSEDLPQWKTYFDEERDANRGFMIVDEPDVEVNVTDSTWFRSLQPGEIFMRKYPIEFLDLHPDTVVGDVYRWQYWGGCIDWWTWGDREEHANTVVILPCWMFPEYSWI